MIKFSVETYWTLTYSIVQHGFIGNFQWTEMSLFQSDVIPVGCYLLFLKCLTRCPCQATNTGVVCWYELLKHYWTLLTVLHYRICCYGFLLSPAYTPCDSNIIQYIICLFVKTKDSTIFYRMSYYDIGLKSVVEHWRAGQVSLVGKASDCQSRSLVQPQKNKTINLKEVSATYFYQLYLKLEWQGLFLHISDTAGYLKTLAHA